MNTLSPDKTPYRVLFFAPQAYNFTIRLKGSIPRYLSWAFINLFTSLFYALHPTSLATTRSIWAAITMAFGILYIYEYGYMHNDAISTTHETAPSLRLNAQQTEYFTKKKNIIFATHSIVFALSLIVTYLLSPHTYTLYAIISAAAIPLLFWLYNHWYSIYKVWLYLPLVVSKFLPFVWLSNYEDTNLLITLIILVYPLEIWIERFSIEKYRFRFMSKLIRTERDKQPLRAIYYAITTPIVALLLQLTFNDIWLITPFIIFAIYRLIMYKISTSKQE